MFIIQTKDVELILEAAPLSALHIHERIIPEAAERLVLQLKNWALLHNPIICGTNNIILDGHHRTYAFKQLGFLYIPVCKIDYKHARTQVRCWFRLLANVTSMNKVTELFKAFGARLMPVDDKEALRIELENYPLSFGLQSKSEVFIAIFPSNIVHDAPQAYDQLEKIQTKLAANGINNSYIPCEAGEDQELASNLASNQVIIWTPQVTKDMVEQAVKENKCFAPKTTRHVIPARPVNVNVPISWFKEDIALGSLNRRFEEFLNKKQVIRLPPGQIIEGRYYEEEVFVFLDKKR